MAESTTLEPWIDQGETAMKTAVTLCQAELDFWLYVRRGPQKSQKKH